VVPDVAVDGLVVALATVVVVDGAVVAVVVAVLPVVLLTPPPWLFVSSPQPASITAAAPTSKRVFVTVLGLVAGELVRIAVSWCREQRTSATRDWSNAPEARLTIGTNRPAG
jgi:hypothetical protein